MTISDTANDDQNDDLSISIDAVKFACNNYPTDVPFRLPIGIPKEHVFSANCENVIEINPYWTTNHVIIFHVVLHVIALYKLTRQL